MASRGARVPARAGGPQRARLVQGEPCPLRRVPPRSGAGARRGPRRPRTAAPLPSLEQHALPTGPAAEGAHRAGDRLRGRGRLLPGALARRPARGRRPPRAAPRSGRPAAPGHRRPAHGGCAHSRAARRGGRRARPQRPGPEARAARLSRRPPARRPAASPPPDRGPPPSSAAVATPRGGRAPDPRGARRRGPVRSVAAAARGAFAAVAVTGELADRLREVLGGPVEHLEQLSGGASRETWVFDLDSRGLVLQLDRVPADEAPGRGARPPQAPLLRAAARAGVPVASVVAAGEDDAVLGSSWTVVERLPGTADPRVILAGDGVPGAERLLDELAAALAAVHRMEVDEGIVPHVTDPLGDLRAMHDELGEPHPVFEFALRELAASRPAASRRTCLVHGDFRMGNVLVGADGVVAVLDWELTHSGDPLEDLGWVCVPAWRFGRMDRPAAGLGSREQLVAAYERHAGVAVDREALR